MSSIADRNGVSSHAVVLAWVLARGPSVIIIPGARTEAHARDSAGVADVELSAEDLNEIGAADFSTA